MDAGTLRKLQRELVAITNRLSRIDKRLTKITHLCQDASHKLCHIIKQQREIFYKAGEINSED